MLGSTDDKDLSRETHSAVCRVLAKSFEGLALHFSQLLAGKHGDLFTQRLRHLEPQSPKVFRRERRVDGKWQQALGWSDCARLAENVAQLARGGKPECVRSIG